MDETENIGSTVNNSFLTYFKISGLKNPIRKVLDIYAQQDSSTNFLF